MEATLVARLHDDSQGPDPSQGPETDHEETADVLVGEGDMEVAEGGAEDTVELPHCDWQAMVRDEDVGMALSLLWHTVALGGDAVPRKDLMQWYGTLRIAFALPNHPGYTGGEVDLAPSMGRFGGWLQEDDLWESCVGDSDAVHALTFERFVNGWINLCASVDFLGWKRARSEIYRDSMHEVDVASEREHVAFAEFTAIAAQRLDRITPAVSRRNTAQRISQLLSRERSAGELSFTPWQAPGSGSNLPTTGGFLFSEAATLQHVDPRFASSSSSGNSSNSSSRKRSAGNQAPPDRTRAAVPVPQEQPVQSKPKSKTKTMTKAKTKAKAKAKQIAKPDHVDSEQGPEVQPTQTPPTPEPPRVDTSPQQKTQSQPKQDEQEPRSHQRQPSMSMDTKSPAKARGHGSRPTAQASSSGVSESGSETSLTTEGTVSTTERAQPTVRFAKSRAASRAAQQSRLKPSRIMRSRSLSRVAGAPDTHTGFGPPRRVNVRPLARFVHKTPVQPVLGSTMPALRSSQSAKEALGIRRGDSGTAPLNNPRLTAEQWGELIPPDLRTKGIVVPGADVTEPHMLDLVHRQPGANTAAGMGMGMDRHDTAAAAATTRTGIAATSSAANTSPLRCARAKGFARIVHAIPPGTNLKTVQFATPRLAAVPDTALPIALGGLPVAPTLQPQLHLQVPTVTAIDRRDEGIAADGNATFLEGTKRLLRRLRWRYGVSPLEKAAALQPFAEVTGIFRDLIPTAPGNIRGTHMVGGAHAHDSGDQEWRRLLQEFELQQALDAQQQQQQQQLTVDYVHTTETYDLALSQSNAEQSLHSAQSLLSFAPNSAVDLSGDRDGHNATDGNKVDEGSVHTVPSTSAEVPSSEQQAGGGANSGSSGGRGSGTRVGGASTAGAVGDDPQQSEGRDVRVPSPIVLSARRGESDIPGATAAGTEPPRSASTDDAETAKPSNDSQSAVPSLQPSERAQSMKSIVDGSTGHAADNHDKFEASVVEESDASLVGNRSQQSHNSRDTVGARSPGQDRVLEQHEAGIASPVSPTAQDISAGRGLGGERVPASLGRGHGTGQGFAPLALPGLSVDALNSQRSAPTPEFRIPTELLAVKEFTLTFASPPARKRASDLDSLPFDHSSMSVPPVVPMPPLASVPLGSESASSRVSEDSTVRKLRHLYEEREETDDVIFQLPEHAPARILDAGFGQRVGLGKSHLSYNAHRLSTRISRYPPVTTRTLANSTAPYYDVLPPPGELNDPHGAWCYLSYDPDDVDAAVQEASAEIQASVEGGRYQSEGGAGTPSASSLAAADSRALSREPSRQNTGSASREQGEAGAVVSGAGPGSASATDAVASEPVSQKNEDDDIDIAAPSPSDMGSEAGATPGPFLGVEEAEGGPQEPPQQQQAQQHQQALAEAVGDTAEGLPAESSLSLSLSSAPNDAAEEAVLSSARTNRHGRASPGVARRSGSPVTDALLRGSAEDDDSSSASGIGPHGSAQSGAPHSARSSVASGQMVVIPQVSGMGEAVAVPVGDGGDVVSSSSSAHGGGGDGVDHGGETTVALNTTTHGSTDEQSGSDGVGVHRPRSVHGRDAASSPPAKASSTSGPARDALSVRDDPETVLPVPSASQSRAQSRAQSGRRTGSRGRRSGGATPFFLACCRCGREATLFCDDCDNIFCVFCWPSVGNHCELGVMLPDTLAASVEASVQHQQAAFPDDGAFDQRGSSVTHRESATTWFEPSPTTADDRLAMGKVTGDESARSDSKAGAGAEANGSHTVESKVQQDSEVKPDQGSKEAESGAAAPPTNVDSPAAPAVESSNAAENDGSVKKEDDGAGKPKGAVEHAELEPAAAKGVADDGDSKAGKPDAKGVTEPSKSVVAATETSVDATTASATAAGGGGSGSATAPAGEKQAAATEEQVAGEQTPTTAEEKEGSEEVGSNEKAVVAVTPDADTSAADKSSTTEAGAGEDLVKPTEPPLARVEHVHGHELTMPVLEEVASEASDRSLGGDSKGSKHVRLKSDKEDAAVPGSGHVPLPANPPLVSVNHAEKQDLTNIMPPREGWAVHEKRAEAAAAPRPVYQRDPSFREYCPQLGGPGVHTGRVHLVPTGVYELPSSGHIAGAADEASTLAEESASSTVESTETVANWELDGQATATGEFEPPTGAAGLWVEEQCRTRPGYLNPVLVERATTAPTNKSRESTAKARSRSRSRRSGRRRGPSRKPYKKDIGVSGRVHFVVPRNRATRGKLVRAVKVSDAPRQALGIGGASMARAPAQSQYLVPIPNAITQVVPPQGEGGMSSSVKLGVFQNVPVYMNPHLKTNNTPLTSPRGSRPGSPKGGSKPGSKPTTRPGSRSGSHPSSRAGSFPPSGPNSKPASHAATPRQPSQPGSQSGSQPGSQPGSRPESRPASRPASRDATRR